MTAIIYRPDFKPRPRPVEPTRGYDPFERERQALLDSMFPPADDSRPCDSAGPEGGAGG